jgi:myo-inositol-1(or 4)-monophosphatase
MSNLTRSIGIKAAKEAGGFLMENLYKIHAVKYKEDSSKVTEIDLKSNEIIINIIKSKFPDHKIISEESGKEEDKIIGNGPTWIIDPLDGTSNYIVKLPLFAVAIAFINNSETQLGIIYDPKGDEMFVAEKGKGSTLNNEPINTSDRVLTRGGMLFAGRGHKQKDRDKHATIICNLEKETSYFRRLGSAAIMLASVAAGRADSVILSGAKSWDTAAGALLVKEAGGKVTDYCGNKWGHKSPDLVATNKHIHDQLINITKGLAEECL